MHLLDAHTHFFSRTFFDLLVAEAPGDSAAVLARMEESAGIEIPSSDAAEHTRRWVEELDRHGVDRAVTFASVPGEAAVVLESVAASGGRLIPYLTCNPTTDAGRGAAIEALRGGFKGLLLFPAVQHFDPADAALDELYEEAAGQRAPVVVHCGILQIKLRDLLGVRPCYDLRHAQPLAVIAAAERHRRTTFVLPHFGGGFFREALIAGAQSPNIFVDTSSSNSWREAQTQELELKDIFARTLRVFGAERIFFGTDSSVFPRGWRHDLFEEQKRALDELAVSASEQNRIFGENLIDQLGL